MRDAKTQAMIRDIERRVDEALAPIMLECTEGDDVTVKIQILAEWLDRASEIAHRTVRRRIEGDCRETVRELLDGIGKGAPE